MSQQVPTTAEIAGVILADLESKLSQTIPVLPKKFYVVLSYALAGVIIILYKYAGGIFLSQFVQFASTALTTINGKQIIPLVEWGRLVGVGDPDAATRWEGIVTVTVITQSGTLAANTLILNTATGYGYLTLAAITLDAATKTVSVRAYSDPDKNGGRGSDGNLEVNDIISFSSPQANVNSDVVVLSVTTTAADAESWDVYRQSIIDRFRSQPQGGAPADFEQWGEEVEGVINVYPYTGDPGEVNLYCEATPASSGSADGIPTGAQLTAVEDSVDVESSGLASRRPINAYVRTIAITRTGFDAEIVSLIVDDETTVKDAISETLTSYFWGREPYIAGLTSGSRRDRISQSAVAGAVEDVVTAFNGTFIAVRVAETVAGDVILYSLGEGEKAKLGNVSYT